jgi:NAD(P)-dependent dehydrogenase (short-subunit alcohol dehydrogenase family)
MATTAVKAGWTPANAPGLDGKVAIVTGATGGVGFETALGLARRGATTVLAGRNDDKGARALARIQSQVPDGKIRFERLDLASLASIRRFADTVIATHGGVIDILVNNAAVMGLPTRRLTEDGFEQQIGVNYLGHFALTAWLKDALCAGTGGGRVVNLASLAHRRGRLGLDDFQSARSYDPMHAYARSKLAMLVFALELQRRAEEKQWNLVGIAVHPGWARTDIIANGMGADSPNVKARLMELAFGLVAQPAREAALPSLYAVMAPEAKGGTYYGPNGFGETRGAPGVAKIFPQAAERSAGAALWALSEELTGVTFG